MSGQVNFFEGLRVAALNDSSRLEASRAKLRRLKRRTRGDGFVIDMHNVASDFKKVLLLLNERTDRRDEELAPADQ